jgi:putrescine transport system substrate-binding protein
VIKGDLFISSPHQPLEPLAAAASFSCESNERRNEDSMWLRKAAFSLVTSLALVVGALAQPVPPAPAGSAGQPTVRVWNFSDYVSPEVLDAFERETGIKVIYDTFDSMEVVETRMLAGRTGYDVVVVTASFLPRQIPLNIYQPLDRARLPNLTHQWPTISERVGRYDPGNRFAVNYMWGTTGIGYNVAAMRQRMGADYRVDTWRLIFDPANLRRFQDCGIHVLDAVEELFPAALNFLGLDPNSKRDADLRRAAELLRSISPFIRKFHSSEYISALASGEICLAVGYSGDILQARKRAKEAAEGTGRPAIEINYAIPNEGALMWFDNFVIPRDAQNPDAAHRFIDFMLRPEMAARNVVTTEFASGNLAAQRLIRLPFCRTHRSTHQQPPWRGSTPSRPTKIARSA